MNKSKGFFPILVPGATVFFSSACIMVLELVAGRLIARHLGSSLYTWTSVIGVVLAGITIGNYLGGRIADRFAARKTTAVLFAISSMACVAVVVLNNLAGEWIWMWRLYWPVRVFTHVSMVFLVPSTLLGTISPVVAKMALDKGLATGRTVGTIYACGAAGSIVGTFLTGFYLIAVMGTVNIIWVVGAALLLMAFLYRARLWVLYLWAAIFIALMTMGIAPGDWAKTAGSSVALREKPDPKILYQDESQYCYIAVERVSEKPDRRAFMQDKLKHSEIIMEDINQLQYFYTHIYTAITRALSQNKEKLSALIIGGGGYVYPRYIEKNWPGSRIDVVEIDPGVTKAAMEAFGLSPETSINTISMDARNYVDQLLQKERTGGKIPKYDFIYEDAINDYSVPYQLVTKEFNDKIARILNGDGVYMINLIDFFDSGRFLGGIINTLEQTFTYVYVLSEIAPRNIRNTFVVAAANTNINVSTIVGQYIKGVDMWYLNDTEITELKQKANEIILTDDYVPVENMLVPVVLQSSLELLSARFRERAAELKQEGKNELAIEKYKELIELDPGMSLLAYNEIGMLSAKLGRPNDAVEAFQKAIEYNEQAEFKINVSSIHHNLAVMLKQSEKVEESNRHFDEAIKGFRQELAKDPDSLVTLSRLANVLVGTGDYNGAAEMFQRLVDLNPYEPTNHISLAKSLEIQGKYNEAIAVLKKAAGFMRYIGNKEAAAKLEKYIELLEFKKSRANK